MERYTPHPLHQLIPFFMLLTAAVLLGMFPGWIMTLVFFAIVIISVVTGVWIAVAGKVREETDYWYWVGESITKLKNAEPEIWEALGFINPPEVVRVENITTGEPGKSDYYTQENFTLKLSPSEMEFLANDLLTGRRGLAEAEWKGTPIGSTRIRDIKKALLKAGFIIQNNPNSPTQGFNLTERGMVYLLQYCSDWVNSSEQLRVMRSRVNQPPTL